MAALQALALRDTLGDGDNDLARRNFWAAAKPIDIAWQLAIGGDLGLPEVGGCRPLPVRIINAYMGRPLTATERVGYAGLWRTEPNETKSETTRRSSRKPSGYWQRILRVSGEVPLTAEAVCRAVLDRR